MQCTIILFLNITFKNSSLQTSANKLHSDWPLNICYTSHSVSEFLHHKYTIRNSSTDFNEIQLDRSSQAIVCYESASAIYARQRN